MQSNRNIDEEEPRSKANRKIWKEYSEEKANKNVSIGGVSEMKVTLMIYQGHMIDRSRNHDITAKVLKEFRRQWKNS